MRKLGTMVLLACALAAIGAGQAQAGTYFYSNGTPLSKPAYLTGSGSLTIQGLFDAKENPWGAEFEVSSVTCNTIARLEAVNGSGWEPKAGANVAGLETFGCTTYTGCTAKGGTQTVTPSVPWAGRLEEGGGAPNGLWLTFKPVFGLEALSLTVVCAWTEGGKAKTATTNIGNYSHEYKAQWENAGSTVNFDSTGSLPPGDQLTGKLHLRPYNEGETITAGIR